MIPCESGSTDESAPETEMFVKTILTVLCTSGVAFYVRFLVALRKDCMRRPRGYWVRLRLDSAEDAMVELPVRQETMTRAA